MDLAAARGSDKLFRCQKSAKDIALAEPHCLNPRGYCKWRSACPIHALEKQGSRRR